MKVEAEIEMTTKLEFKVLKTTDEDIATMNTMVFIDYESLFISFSKEYCQAPMLDQLLTELKSSGKILKIFAFGDFTKPEISQERNHIRTITSNIIDCGNESLNSKKDFTDFIMLDHVYQELIQTKDIQQFILVTGDGHFSSAATFIRTFMDKTVGVYGVYGSLSRQLKECSSWTKELSVSDADEAEYRSQRLYLCPTSKGKVTH